MGPVDYHLVELHSCVHPSHVGLIPAVQKEGETESTVLHYVETSSHFDELRKHVTSTGKMSREVQQLTA